MIVLSVIKILFNFNSVKSGYVIAYLKDVLTL